MTNLEILEDLQNKVNDLMNYLKPEKAKEPEEPENDKEFTFRRNVFVAAGTFISAGFAYTMFHWYLPLFNIAFGFFIAYGMLAFILLFDEFILPGNTIRRISKNAIASAIAVYSFAYVVIAGAQIGSALITDPYRSEEYRATQQYTAPPSGNVEMRRDTGTTAREQ